MKKLVLGACTLGLFLSGCVVVKDRKPESTTTTTTRQTSATIPATTTVERTTVY